MFFITVAVFYCGCFLYVNKNPGRFLKIYKICRDPVGDLIICIYKSFVDRKFFLSLSIVGRHSPRFATSSSISAFQSSAMGSQQERIQAMASPTTL